MFGIDISDDKDTDPLEGIEDDKQVYIDLHSFLKILSKWVIPVDEASKKPILPLSTYSREYVNGKKEPLMCLYHPLQISVDPYICLIKNTKIKLTLKDKIPAIDNGTISIFIPEITYPNDIKKQTFSFLTKQWMNNLFHGIADINKGNVKENAEDKSRLIQLETNVLIQTAFSRGINKKDATEIIANAWEEFKYNQFNPQPRVTKAAAYSIYIIDLSGSDVFTSDEFKIDKKINNLDKQAALIKTSKLSFKQIIKYKLDNDEEQIKLVLGDDYDNFYNPSEGIASLSAISIKAKADLIDNKALIDNLELKGIDFLEKLHLNYEYNNTGFATIGNIYINLNNIVNLSTDGELEGNDVKEKREINLYDFLKKLINQVHGSIGSVNNFDIHVDPIDGIGRIIDINYVDTESRAEAYKNAYTFLSNTPTGLNLPTFDNLFTNVRSYKITSQIFKEQSSIVAISAQNGGGIMGLDNETLVGFQKGLTNRLLPNSNPLASFNAYNRQIQDKNKMIGIINLSLLTFTTFLEDIKWINNKIYFDKTRTYNVSNTNKYKNQLRDFIAAYQSLTVTESSFRSIIPTTLSLELDGIGGLIIGHIFRFPLELLPVGYKNSNYGRKQGYIITRLGHKISNSDWVTTIDAQTIILENPNYIKFDLGKALAPASPTTAPTASPTAPTASPTAPTASPTAPTASPTAPTASPTAPTASNKTTLSEATIYYNTILDKLGAPKTEGNIIFFKAWRQAEGGEATWNGFNTTINKIGSTIYNSANVRNYPSLDVGTQAIVDTILNGGKKYVNLLNAFRTGLKDQKEALNLAIELEQPKKDLFIWVKDPNSKELELGNYVANILKGIVRDIMIYKA
jgi:hypothetical protein